LCPVTHLISGWLGFSLFVALLILAIFMLGIVGFLYARSKLYFRS
jgi:VIT1/CCC1 family predicted Fe2+/Mn2+ transporter